MFWVNYPFKHGHPSLDRDCNSFTVAENHAHVRYTSVYFYYYYF